MSGMPYHELTPLRCAGLVVSVVLDNPVVYGDRTDMAHTGLEVVGIADIGLEGVTWADVDIGSWQEGIVDIGPEGVAWADADIGS